MTPDLGGILEAHAGRLLGSLPTGWADRIAAYLDLLHVWNQRFRLTGDRDERRLALHHVADCVAVAPQIPAGGTFVDIGSGAGLPGIVLAISRPDVGGTLIESRRRPVAFLREACRVLAVDRIRVVEARAEGFAVEPPPWWVPADLAVSRALKADAFLELARPLVHDGGAAVLMRTPAAPAVAIPVGWQADRIVDYDLPDGTPRRLQLLRRVC